MGKFLIYILVLTSLTAAQTPNKILQKNCISCHVKQQIPSELIYRRYLTQYSTHNVIKQKLFDYLKAPNKESSIMPKQFFLKFPTKEALHLNDTDLNTSIDAYLEYFDIRKKLVLP